MMLEIEAQWPVTLPLPLVNYQGSPDTPTIVSPQKHIAILRRSRFVHTYRNLSVAWMLTDDQHEDLKTFFQDELGNGAAQFKIELRYPLNSELTEWACKFTGGFLSTRKDGLWDVQTSIQLISPTEI